MIELFGLKRKYSESANYRFRERLLSFETVSVRTSPQELQCILHTSLWSFKHVEMTKCEQRPPGKANRWDYILNKCIAVLHTVSAVFISMITMVSAQSFKPDVYIIITSVYWYLSLTGQQI